MAGMKLPTQDKERIREGHVSTSLGWAGPQPQVPFVLIYKSLIFLEVSPNKGKKSSLIERKRKIRLRCRRSEGGGHFSRERERERLIERRVRGSLKLRSSSSLSGIVLLYPFVFCFLFSLSSPSCSFSCFVLTQCD